MCDRQWNIGNGPSTRSGSGGPPSSGASQTATDPRQQRLVVPWA
jgi:hypothetical protein